MSNPILLVENAGRGETPPCPVARFAVGDIVRLRKRTHLRHLPELGAVAAVVPPGFPPEYALADAARQPRPLQISKPARAVTYIVGFEGTPKPHLLFERDLLPTDQPKAAVTWADGNGEAKP